MPAATGGKRAPKIQTIDLAEAASQAGYSREYLRKLMWSGDPPPLVKLHGRWRAIVPDFDEWLARRRSEGLAS